MIYDYFMCLYFLFNQNIGKEEAQDTVQDCQDSQVDKLQGILKVYSYKCQSQEENMNVTSDHEDEVVYVSDGEPFEDENN